VLFAAGVTALGLLAWQLRSVFLLVFGALILATTSKRTAFPGSVSAARRVLRLGRWATLPLMGMMALYFAADPVRYRAGFLRLFPVGHRQRVGEALKAASRGLGSWLMGQGISMMFVGTTTAVGLALLGVPLALSLGVIAGVFAFIPFFGPIASGIVAVAFAFVEGPRTALYVAGLCFAIQQVEGDVLMPFVQKWAVSLPPVLAVVAVVVFGLLFGVLGIILATPLMVVVMILVRRLYVEGVLEARLDGNSGGQ
jgi:predicted PurR-regulated permease PerM